MADVPLMAAVAKNLKTIRSQAPKLGIVKPGKVARLKASRA